MKRLTTLAQETILPHLLPGGRAIDATAGNGHDTLFLANHLGPTGRVYAFDIQQEALRQTRIRLSQAALDGRVELLPTCHSRMEECLPEHERGLIQAVVFNLGYLPSGNHALTTLTPTTLAALRAARRLLSGRGILSVMAYPGHPGGREETQSVREWMNGQRSVGDAIQEQAPDPEGPHWFLLRPGSA